MTKIAISPNVNSTGTFTLAAPDSNTNRTLAQRQAWRDEIRELEA